MDFFMGGVSDAVSKTAAAPIERVKLLIQNQDEMINTSRLSEPHKGIANCFGKTMKEEGVVSLWRGNTTIIIRYFPTQDSYFGSFRLGWCITIGAELASYPLDTIGRMMMITSGESIKYKGSQDCFNQMVKECVKSLFKGAGANIRRAVAGTGVLAGYDELRLLFSNKYGSGGA